jgi:signal transduction histidine kinase
LVALRDDNGNLLGYGKILRNRTDLREQLDGLHNQVEALLKADQRKNVFLATLSHELRNPLAPLSNAVQLLRMTAVDSDNLQYPINLIEQQVEFIRGLIDDLLDVTRISSGKVRLNKRTIVLNEVINRAVEATRAAIEERDHTLRVFLPSAPIRLQADPDRLHQVLVNLLTNAAKYTPEKGEISLRGTTEGDEAVIHVEDTGVGIPHEMLPRIFELFTQMEPNLSQGGLGIGLALVKELVALHGGSVQVRSDGVGKGSEFTVRLPLKSSED